MNQVTQITAPSTIEISFDTPVFVPHSEQFFEIARRNLLGAILPDNIERGEMRFEETEIYRSFEQVFTHGYDWSMTEFFRQNADKIASGKIIWNCKSSDDLLARLNHDVRGLYASIASNGYLTQAQIIERSYLETLPASMKRFEEYIEPLSTNHEIKLGVNAEGQFMIVDGMHRLAIAKLLQLKRIPVQIAFRQEEWAGFHAHLTDVAQGLNAQRLYQKLEHPDLAYLEYAHGDERFPFMDAALEKIGTEDGISKTILDIGANTGLLSRYLARKGYRCTSVENNEAYTNIAKKVNFALNLDINTITANIFDFDPSGFDIIAAFNIFHHFTNDEHTFSRFTEFLKKIDSRWLIFQPHNMYSGDAGFGKYRQFSSDGFAEYVRDMAGFNQITHLATDTSDLRNVYLLQR